MIERVASVGVERRRALYSKCERYRYLLEILWPTPGGRPRPVVQFIGLNPSTATELADDQTIRKCKAFARAWGLGGLVMTNLAAYRATAPREMLAAADPIGPANSSLFLASVHLQHLVDAKQYTPKREPVVIACWGAKGAHSLLSDHASSVRERLKPWLCALEVCGNGEPSHPLYLPGTRIPRLLGEFLP